MRTRTPATAVRAAALLALALASVLSFPSRARAETLEQKVERLERIIKQQQERIEKLEGRKAAPSAPAEPKVKIGGDFRLRYSIDDRDRYSKGTDQRDRIRVRFRVKLTFNYSAKLRFIARLTTRNHTLDDRLAEGTTAYFDRFYADWRPTDSLTILAGVFSNRFYNSEMMWDPIFTNMGLYGELHGSGESSSWKVKAAAIVVQDDYWSGIADDLYLMALGVQFKWKIASKTTLDLRLNYLDFSDEITTLDLGSNRGNYNTGGLRTDEYDLINPYVAVVCKLRNGKPLKFWSELVHNTGADEEDTGWQVGASLGKLWKEGDWMISAYYEELEANSAVDIFTRFNFHGGMTNAKGFNVTLGYTVRDNWIVQLRAYITQAIEGDKYDWDNYQFQTIVKF